MDYKNSGVDIEAGYKSVELMKEHVKKTMREEVLGGLGGFAGAFSRRRHPIFQSGTGSSADFPTWCWSWKHEKEAAP